MSGSTYWMRIKGKDSTAKAFAAVDSRMKKLDTSLTGVTGSFSGLASSGAMAAAAVAAIGAAAASLAREMSKNVILAGDYQHQLLTVNTLMGLSSKRLDALSVSLRDMSVRYGQTFENMSNAEYNIISAGFSGIAESLDILGVASRGAIGGVSDVNTVAQTITLILNAYKKDASDAAHISDVLFQTIKLGVTTMPELASEMGKVATTAATAGISFEELSAAIAVLTKRGVNTTMAATALNSLIIALGASSGDSKKKLEAMGITLDGGLAQALEKINRSGGDSLDVLKSIVPNIRALRAAAAVGADGAKELYAALDKIGHSAGSADAAYNQMADDFVNQTSRLSEANKRLRTALGDYLVPVVSAVKSSLAALENAAAEYYENDLRDLKEHSRKSSAEWETLQSSQTGYIFGLDRIGAAAVSATAALAEFNAEGLRSASSVPLIFTQDGAFNYLGVSRTMADPSFGVVTPAPVIPKIIEPAQTDEIQDALDEYDDMQAALQAVHDMAEETRKRLADDLPPAVKTLGNTFEVASEKIKNSLAGDMRDFASNVVDLMLFARGSAEELADAIDAVMNRITSRLLDAGLDSLFDSGNTGGGYGPDFIGPVQSGGNKSLLSGGTAAAGGYTAGNKSLSGNTNITFNVNAIDAAGTRDFIYRSKEMIVGVVAQATRRAGGIKIA